MNVSHIAIALMLTTTPSFAACHHYTTWHYKFPQSCKVGRTQAPFNPTPPNLKDWYVELTYIPPIPEEPTPAVKQELNEQLIALAYTKYYKKPWINQCVKQSTLAKCEDAWAKLAASCKSVSSETDLQCDLQKDKSHD